MSLPLESSIEAIVTFYFGRRSSLMAYLESLVRRSKKPFATL